MSYRFKSRLFAGLLCMVVALAAGCGHKPAAASLPAEEDAPRLPAESRQPAEHSQAMGRIAPTPAPPGGVTEEDLRYIATHRPILRETGIASWYGAPYKGRRSANGDLFDDSAMTAAERTLPMGSLVKVTNLETGQSAAVRITDRGPFVEGRILDLTVAAAKALGVYRPGTARVRIDVYRTPKPIDTGGRWCVQIGAFTSDGALKLKSRLMDKYPDAQVIEFAGSGAYWVRIRPAGDDRTQAERIADHLKPAEGKAYLTRLD